MFQESASIAYKHRVLPDNTHHPIFEGKSWVDRVALVATAAIPRGFKQAPLSESAFQNISIII